MKGRPRGFRVLAAGCRRSHRLEPKTETESPFAGLTHLAVQNGLHDPGGGHEGRLICNGDPP